MYWSPVLDYVEWLSRGPDDPIAIAFSGAAPTFASAKRVAENWFPSVSDVDDGNDASAATEAFAIQLGRLVKSRVGTVQPWSQISQIDIFERRFLSANQSAPSNVSELAPCSDGFSEVSRVTVEISLDQLSSLDLPSQFIALVGTAIPSAAFAEKEIRASAANKVRMPNGQDYLHNPVRLRSPLRKQALQLLVDELVKRWPETEWTYLRRLGMLPQTAPASGLLDNFPLAFVGMSATWPASFLFNYALATVEKTRTGAMTSKSATVALILARLSASSAGLGKIAIDAIGEIESTSVPQRLRMLLLLELANINAQQRTGEGFRRAEQLIGRGLAEQQIDTLLKARLLNVLALVRYHQHRDAEALEIERQAAELLSHSDRNDANAWYNAALLPNVALLLERRFDRDDEAIDIYISSIAGCSVRESVQSRLRVARLLVKRSEWQKTIDVLLPISTDVLVSFSNAFLINFILSAAFLAVGQEERATHHRKRCSSILSKFPRSELTRLVNGSAS